MTPPRADATTITLAEAAELLASGQGAVGLRLRRTVESQLVRRGVAAADRDDVLADVAYALLTSSRTGPLALATACAQVALIARNKAVDQHRRRRFETPSDTLAEQADAPPDGALQRDLDVVSGEGHAAFRVERHEI